MKDAYGGITVKERPAKIHAVQFNGKNVTDIARWLELHTYAWDIRTEMYPGDAEPQLVIGDTRFCVSDWLVIVAGKLSRFTPKKFDAAFEVIE